MQYDKPAFLYPPRPENKIAAGFLGFYEKKGWVAQVKKNGDCTEIITNGRDVIFKTRLGDDVGRWTPDKEVLNFFGGKKPGKWNVYVAELMHSHGTVLKNHLYIFDKIVHEGVQLVGTTFESRQAILSEHTKIWLAERDSSRIGTGEPVDRVPINARVSVAKCFTSGFGAMFKGISERQIPDDEGLVLKNPKGILQPCFKATANDGWMVKIRRPNKNLGF